MSDKQLQKAGDNSKQIQTGDIYISNGISEQRVREICSEIAGKAIADNSREAIDIAMKRIDFFTDLLLPRMQSIEKAFDSFSDPSFQVLLRKAQLTAACSDRDSDFKILIELLTHRVKNKKDIKKKASISKAIEIIDQIDDDSLYALTLIHAIDSFVPTTGNIFQGIKTLSDLYEKIGYINLPKDNLWVDNLSILGCINVSPLFIQNDFEEQFFNRLNGYTCAGIKKEDENYKKAIELLNKYGISTNILVDHELNEGYVRLCVAQKVQIKDLSLHQVVNINGIPQIVNVQLTEEQKLCLNQIFELSSKDAVAIKRVKEKFLEQLNSHEPIKQIIEWRNKVGTAFNLTSIGKVIAHANAKKIDKTRPDLD